MDLSMCTLILSVRSCPLVMHPSRQIILNTPLSMRLYPNYPLISSVHPVLPGLDSASTASRVERWNLAPIATTAEVTSIS